MFTCDTAALASAGQYPDSLELIPQQAKAIILVACLQVFYLGPYKLQEDMSLNSKSTYPQLNFLLSGTQNMPAVTLRPPNTWGM